MIIPKIENLKKQSFDELLDTELLKKLNKRKALYRFIKRILDIIFAIFTLIIFSPIWILILFLIRIDSKGKAIFSHIRAGKNGKLFRLYKFRTMHQEAKDQEHAPLSIKDPRITKVGKLLRITSLDEVPQFWNVIKGEMSVVGPRPEMPFIVKKYNELEKTRLLITPGITGLWQIAGRKDLPLHKNVEYDLHYILHQSPQLDLIILLKTISVVLNEKGAY